MIRVKKTLSLLLLLTIQAYGVDIVDKYFEQKLDHTGTLPGTWKQRYVENGEFFKPGGPIFMNYGGGCFSKVGPDAVTKGSMVRHAKALGAHIVQFEARFYGKSRPTPDLSTENLHKYMTVDNGMQDGIAFTKWFKSQPQFKDSKVVGFGHVYMGSRMLNNMRVQPGLIDIGVASSAPVETKFEIPEYTKQEMEILRNVSVECAVTLHDAVLCLDKILNGGKCEGHDVNDLKETFNLCGEVDPSKKLDNAALIGEILKMVGFVVLLDDPTADYNVHKMCDAMGDLSKGLSHVDKLAGEIKKIVENSKKPCLEFRFDELEKRLEITSWEHAEKTKFERVRIFFRCKYTMTLRTPEGLDLPEERLESYRAYNLEMCKQAFGISRDEVRMGTEATNKKYGMRQIPNKCVIFMTEAEDLIKSLEINTEKEAGKCNAFLESQDGGILADEIDAEDAKGGVKGLKECQQRIGRILDVWLKTGDCCVPVAK